MGEKKVLLVDADESMRSRVKKCLEKSGLQMIEAADGKKALELFEIHREGLCLLLTDVEIPMYDGFTVCREIRRQSDIPILILTDRQEDFAEIYGFESGADDYVRKPVNPSVLSARIQALLKRFYPETDKKMYFSNLEIDDASHQVLSWGEEISLSPKEYSILLALAENRGKIISREELLQKVWGYYYYGGLRTVDTHINRLRVKLGKSGENIHTIHGFGYRFEDKIQEP